MQIKFQLNIIFSYCLVWWIVANLHSFAENSVQMFFLFKSSYRFITKHFIFDVIFPGKWRISFSLYTFLALNLILSLFMLPVFIRISLALDCIGIEYQVTNTPDCLPIRPCLSLDCWSEGDKWPLIALITELHLHHTSQLNRNFSTKDMVS